MLLAEEENKSFRETTVYFITDILFFIYFFILFCTWRGLSVSVCAWRLVSWDYVLAGDFGQVEFSTVAQHSYTSCVMFEVPRC